MIELEKPAGVEIRGNLQGLDKPAGRQDAADLDGDW